MASGKKNKDYSFNFVTQQHSQS